jgi:hypothetical protein
MSYTYPPAAPTVSGDNITIHRFLQNPTLVARRLRTLLQQRYIADALLKGRFAVSGGAIVTESGDSLFTGESPRAVSAGGEYPLVTVGGGTPSLVKTVKWGQDSEVTDESIKRLQMDPVNRALTKLANQNVKHVDSVALSVIASSVTATQAAAATWATADAEQILLDVMTAKARVIAQNEGHDPDTVAVDDINWAIAMAKFAAAGYLPRENNAQNPVLTGDFPLIAGMRWLATPNVPVLGTALVVDSEQLGGMADEDLGGPGYVSAAGPGTAAVETKVMRQDEEDKYRLRARRVTVPVVVDAGAGRTITGLGVPA